LLDGYTGFGGPTSFGSGGLTLANSASASASGNLVGIDEFDKLLLVPHSYVSGSPLMDSVTYSGATFSSLGVTPGTYEWTWGTGANQNFTLQIGPVAGVPDSGLTSMLLLLGLTAMLGFKRIVRQSV
jgi:hypothetical protein